MRVALIPGLQAKEKYRGEQSGWAHQLAYQLANSG